MRNFNKETLIGKGSSRTVYASGDKVLKVASGRYKRLMRGLAQNRAEYEIWKYATSEHGVTHLCPIYDITPDDEVLTMAKAMPINVASRVPDELRPKLRLFKRRLKYIYAALIYRAGRHELDLEDQIRCAEPHKQEEMRKTFRSKLFYDACVLIFDYGLTLGDFVRLSSWGYYKGRFVMVDYGGTKRVLEEYYDRHFTPGIAV